MIDNSCKEAIHACFTRLIILENNWGFFDNRAKLAQAIVGTCDDCLGLFTSLNNPAHKIHFLPDLDQRAIVGVLKRLQVSLVKLQDALFYASDNKSAVLQASVQAHRLQRYLSDFNVSFSEWQGNVEAGADPLDYRPQVSSMNTHLDYFNSVTETTCEMAQLVEDAEIDL